MGIARFAGRPMARSRHSDIRYNPRTGEFEEIETAPRVRRRARPTVNRTRPSGRGGGHGWLTLLAWILVAFAVAFFWWRWNKGEKISDGEPKKIATARKNA